jgi:hypothetical protein
VDAFAWNTVCRAIRDDVFLRGLVTQTDDISHPARRLDLAQQELRDLETQQGRCLKKIGLLDPDDAHYETDEEAYRREMHSYDAKIAAANERLQRLQDEAIRLAQRQQVVEEFQHYADAQREQLGNLTAAQRRAILTHLRVRLGAGADDLRSVRKWLGNDEDGWYAPPRIAMTLNLVNDPEAVKRLAQRWRHYSTHDPAAMWDAHNATTYFAVLGAQPKLSPPVPVDRDFLDLAMSIKSRWRIVSHPQQPLTHPRKRMKNHHAT